MALDNLTRALVAGRQRVKTYMAQEMTYAQMLALADHFEGWAMDARLKPERAAWLTGASEGLEALAEQLGPSWSPPEPEKLTLWGFLARLANGDQVRPDQTPAGRRRAEHRD